MKPKKESKKQHQDMPTDPKDLAKAMFRAADKKFEGFQTKFQRQKQIKDVDYICQVIFVIPLFIVFPSTSTSYCLYPILPSC